MDEDEATGGLPADLGDRLTATFASIFDSFQQYYSDIALLINDIAILVAIILAIITLYKIKSHMQNPDRHPVSHIIALAIVTGLMANVGATMNIGSQTIFGEDYSFLSYRDISAAGSEIGDQARAILQGVVGFVQVVGIAAGFYGILVWKDLGSPNARQGERTFSKGLLFFVAGILAANILWTMQLLANSMGLSAAYTAVFGGGG